MDLDASGRIRMYVKFLLRRKERINMHGLSKLKVPSSNSGHSPDSFSACNMHSILINSSQHMILTCSLFIGGSITQSMLSGLMWVIRSICNLMNKHAVRGNQSSRTICYRSPSENARLGRGLVFDDEVAAQRMRLRRNFGCAPTQFQKQGSKVVRNFGEAGVWEDREEEKDQVERKVV